MTNKSKSSFLLLSLVTWGLSGCSTFLDPTYQERTLFVLATAILLTATGCLLLPGPPTAP